jgi:hypothetical protein
MAADGPYGLSAQIGAVVLAGFVFASVLQGVLTGDVAGMLRRTVVHVPAAVFGTIALVAVTQALVKVVDELSDHVLGVFDADLGALADATVRLTQQVPSSAGGFIVLLVGTLTAVGGLVVIAELAVRSALVYLVVVLGPLAFAAAVWPALRTAARHLLELLGALIVSKLVIALALAVAAAALASLDAGGADELALPAPGASTGSSGDTTAETVGVLLAGLAAFTVAAFSPLLLVGLFGPTAGAVAGQGVRSMPLRGGQRAVRVASTVTAVATGHPGLAASAAVRREGTPPGGPGAGTTFGATPSGNGSAHIVGGQAGPRPAGRSTGVAGNGSSASPHASTAPDGSPPPASPAPDRRTGSSRGGPTSSSALSPRAASGGGARGG